MFHERPHAARADLVSRTEPSRAEQAFAAGQLGIRSERRGSDHVVALSGELDLATAQGAESELRAAEATDAAQIILDLADLDFIDSTGLQLIIAADARCRAGGPRLRLLPGPPQVQRIFEITATTDILPFAK
ncbi:MAG: STAS domain-containing protein [Solirubrobacteraceae bacterium]|nr:STAS domain-containing protein [Solirubrobacteraceae bacterium]